MDETRAEGTIVIFTTRFYSQDDATIKDWRYDHTAVPDSQISKREYQMIRNGWHDAGRKRKTIKRSHLRRIPSREGGTIKRCLVARVHGDPRRVVVANGARIRGDKNLTSYHII